MTVVGRAKRPTKEMDMSHGQPLRESFRRAVGFGVIDPYSSNSWAKEIGSIGSIRYERLNIQAETAASVPCTLLYHEPISQRPVLLDMRSGQLNPGATWVGSLLANGTSILSADLSEPAPDGRALNRAAADIWRLVSYLSLRNDLVRFDRIYGLASVGHAEAALSAAALDPRLCGLILMGSSSLTTLISLPATPKGTALEMALVLTCPRPLGLILAEPPQATAGSSYAVADVAQSVYTKAGNSERLRTTGSDDLGRLVAWMSAFPLDSTNRESSLRGEQLW